MEGRLEHWKEWKRLCALERCSDAARATLHQFAMTRFSKYAGRYGSFDSQAQARHVMQDGRHAWHLFETYLTVRKNRQGKAYKDWLFARQGTSDDAPLDIIQGGATLLMRDVVRDWLRQETTPRFFVSMHRPVGNREAGTITIEELLPVYDDPADQAVMHEYQQLARKHAVDFFAQMRPRVRVAVLARARGIPLSHPATVQAAGCSKSGLHQSLMNWLRNIKTKIHELYPDEGLREKSLLTALIMEALQERIFIWISMEKSCIRFFRLMENSEKDVPHASTAENK
jgi:hypothetical protein